MIRKAVETLGQRIENVGDEFMEEHYAWRVEHPDARETPNNSLYSAVAQRFQRSGQALVSLVSEERK